LKKSESLASGAFRRKPADNVKSALEDNHATGSPMVASRRRQRLDERTDVPVVTTWASIEKTGALGEPKTGTAARKAAAKQRMRMVPPDTYATISSMAMKSFYGAEA
jgi:hypothetical protein